MKLSIDCEHGKHLCDKNQYNEITFLERITLIFHLLVCPSCKKYTKSNTKLTKKIKEANLKSIPLERKEAMKERIAQELNKL